jgi:DNA-binding MarR family transcriptional regulator
MPNPSDPGRSPGAANQTTAGADLTQREYEQLANFRHTLRQLFRQIELEAAKVGVSPQQYQLLLAIKGFPGRDWANISELAERLQVRHNAVIGLVNRAVASGYVERRQDADRTDRRTVRVTLTPEGERVLQVLVSALRQERLRVREAMNELGIEAGADDTVTPHK